MSGRPKRIRVGSVTTGAQTYQPEQAGGDRIQEWQIQDAGERAIVHHFGCPRSAPLHYVLVSDAITYRCWGCDARASVGPDGQPVGPKAPAAEPAAPVAPATPNPGTAGYPTKAQVLATQAALAADGADAGARSIADVLGCHETTIRRRLGRRK